MNIEKYENKLLEQLSKIVEDLVFKNQQLAISAKSRVGAEISTVLEEKFVETAERSRFFSHCEKAPPEKTKNPFDARAIFKYKGIEEVVWIDFKAVKVTQKDSNPDMGTVDKIIKFIKNGNFYYLYVTVFYCEVGDGIEFKKIDNKYVKVFLLKDIDSSFRRTPTNQMQVNISKPSKYRSREDFIDIFVEKMKESYLRQINKGKEKLEGLEETLRELKEANNNSENKFKN